MKEIDNLDDHIERLRVRLKRILSEMSTLNGELIGLEENYFEKKFFLKITSFFSFKKSQKYFNTEMIKLDIMRRNLLQDIKIVSEVKFVLTAIIDIIYYEAMKHFNQILTKDSYEKLSLNYIEMCELSEMILKNVKNDFTIENLDLYLLCRNGKSKFSKIKNKMWGGDNNLDSLEFVDITEDIRNEHNFEKSDIYLFENFQLYKNFKNPKDLIKVALQQNWSYEEYLKVNNIIRTVFLAILDSKKMIELQEKEDERLLKSIPIDFIKKGCINELDEKTLLFTKQMLLEQYVTFSKEKKDEQKKEIISLILSVNESL